jgi:deazaflavin-dependent oxidoreductase (nitroreductase family)
VADRGSRRGAPRALGRCGEPTGGVRESQIPEPAEVAEQAAEGKITIEGARIVALAEAAAAHELSESGHLGGRILINPSRPARTPTQGEDMDGDEFNARNKQVIEEFRANGGKLAGQFADAPILLLYTKGRRSGKEFLNPLAYYADGDRYLVFASKGGADTHPDWYLNLVAAPTAHIEVGTESFDVQVTDLQGEERDRLYAAQAEVMPNFAEYQAKTERVIPVIALSRI